MSSSSPEERKKQLAKQLSEWKSSFSKEQGRKPTQEDIEADETVNAWFNEYTALKKELTAGATTASEVSSSVATTAPAAVSEEANNNNTNENNTDNDKNNNKPSNEDESSPAPPPHQQPSTTDDDHRKKELAKILNEWKSSFKAAHDGKGPGQEDIDNDPAIKAVFDEFTCIKKGIPYVPSAPAAATTEVEKEQDHQEQQQPSASSTAAAAAADVDPEARKKELAKMLSEWKKSFTTEQDRKPKQEDIDADPKVKAWFDEYTLLKNGGVPPPAATTVDEKPTAPAAPEANESTAPVPAPTTETTPTSEEQQQPSTTSEPTDDQQQKQTPAAATEEEESPEERKKHLAKQLSEWKKTFTTEQGRKPKQEDIEADSSVKAWFDEYTALKKVSEEEKPKEDETKPVHRQEQEHEQEQQQPPATTVSTALEPTPPAPASEPEALSNNDTDNNNNNNNNTGIAEEQQQDPEARKKELAKELSEWKKSFTVEQNRKPKQEDIDADPKVKAWFDEYTLLKNGGVPPAKPEEATEKPTVPAAPEAEATAAPETTETTTTTQEQEKPASSSESQQHQQQQDPEARKKELAKELSEWKKSFTTEQGRKPKQEDIDADPKVKSWFDEYTILKNGGVPNNKEETNNTNNTTSTAAVVDENRQPLAPAAVSNTTSAEPEPEQQQQQQPAAADEESLTTPETRKKELAKILSDWKHSFKTEHDGKGPRQSDIDHDEKISLVFVEYTSLKGGASLDEAKEAVEKHTAERKAKQEQQEQEEKDQRIEAEKRRATAAEQLKQQVDENENKPQQQQQQEAVPPTKMTAEEMKKAVTKQLSDWKSSFQSSNDRKPKQSDIEADPEINIIFKQYTLLKKGGSVEDAEGIRKEAKDERRANQEMMNNMITITQPQDDDDNNNNNRYDNDNNNQDDDTISRSNNNNYDNDDNDDQYYSPTSLEDVAARDERKKQLVKILGEWKANFRSIHGKNPSQSDVMGDPEIREVYEEYACLKQGKPYFRKNGDGSGNNSNNNNDIERFTGTLSNALAGSSRDIYGDDDNDGSPQNQQYDPNFINSGSNNPEGGFTYTGQVNLDYQPTAIPLDDDDANNNNQNQDNNGAAEGTFGAEGSGMGLTNEASSGGFLRWLGDDEKHTEGGGVDAVTHEHNIKMWENATARARLFTILQPSSSLIQPFPSYQKATAVYHLIYLTLLLCYMGMALAETSLDSGVNNLSRIIFLGIPNLWFTMDFVLRAGTTNEWQYVPMLLIDLASMVTCWIHLSDREVFANDGDIVRMIPQLRMFRLMLFTSLFIRKDFFRDIEIALLTVQSSLIPLFLFFVIFFVFLLLFSTFIFLTERGEYNLVAGVWERPCREFVSNCIGVEKSPFQSIPDGLWLTVQVMTTVGFGDTVPTSFWGRVVAGIAMVVGVFTIAFPTMLFVGNLAQVRKDFYAQLERERIERSYRLDMIKILQEQQAAVERAENAKQMEMTMDLGATMNNAMNATMNATMNFATLGMKVSRDSNMVLFDEATANADEIPAQPLKGPTVALFSFMGHHAREVKKTRRGEFVYEPILEFLCDQEDGAPVLSSVVEIDFNVYMGQLTLIVDDLVAQELATEAVFDTLGDEAPENGVAAKAVGVYNLEVALQTSVPGLKVSRRIDATKVNENAVPITLEIEVGAADREAVYDAQTAKEFARVALSRANASFKVSYSRAPVSTAIWQKSVPITSIMLSTTPFIHDLLEISTYASVADLLPSSEKRKSANKTARRRRNIAFVHQSDVAELVYPVYRKVIGGSPYVIRNAAHFVDSLTEMISLHCRRVRHHEIPEGLRDAIYNREDISLSEELLEVDLDYFRSVDWPLGTSVVEFAEQRVRVSLIVTSTGGLNLEQPIIADANAFERTGVFEKESLHRLSTALNFEDGEGDNIDVFDTFGGSGQNPAVRSNLFASGVSNEKKLASLLAPTEVTSF